MNQQSPQAATSPAEDQLRKPVEAGKLPAKSDAVLSKVEIDGRTYSERVWKEISTVTNEESSRQGANFRASLTGCPDFLFQGAPNRTGSSGS